jgi:hypothetical protein
MAGRLASAGGVASRQQTDDRFRRRAICPVSLIPFLSGVDAPDRTPRGAGDVFELSDLVVKSAKVNLEHYFDD